MAKLANNFFFFSFFVVVFFVVFVIVLVVVGVLVIVLVVITNVITPLPFNTNCYPEIKSKIEMSE